MWDEVGKDHYKLLAYPSYCPLGPLKCSDIYVNIRRCIVKIYKY